MFVIKRALLRGISDSEQNPFLIARFLEETVGFDSRANSIADTSTG